MRLTLTHMLSFEANASPFSALALDRLPMCSCVCMSSRCPTCAPSGSNMHMSQQRFAATC